MNVLVKRTGDVYKPNRVVGVTLIEHAFEIESSAGCMMIVSLLVVTTKVAAPDVDAPDEDGTAARTRRPQPAVHYNQHQTDTIEQFCSNQSCSGPSTISDTYVAKK